MEGNKGPLANRDDFPILRESIQLCSCSQSALHVRVKQALADYVVSWETRGQDWDAWMAVCEDARAKFAQLINAKPTEIAIVSSVSHAVSAIATSLARPKDRRRVVTTMMDFPCIGHVWLSQQDLDVSFIPPVDYQIPLEAYQTSLDSHTLLLSTFHFAYYNGFKQDIGRIAEMAHQAGAYLLVDAYQAAGQVEIDVKAMDIDFLVSGLQKYLLGTPGLAFLYVKEEIAEQLTPRITGWFGQAEPFAFDVSHVEYAPGARRFDSGTFPMIAGYAASAGLDVMLEIGVANIEEYLADLSTFALEYASSKGLTVRSPRDVRRKGSNTAILVPDSHQIEELMRSKGFIVSARADVIRIAPHFYNTEDDIRGAVDALSDILAKGETA